MLTSSRTIEISVDVENQSRTFILLEPLFLRFEPFVKKNEFRVFRVRELAGRSGSASKTPPLNPPRRRFQFATVHILRVKRGDMHEILGAGLGILRLDLDEVR